jgi:hypothetical protein
MRVGCAKLKGRYCGTKCRRLVLVQGTRECKYFISIGNLVRGENTRIASKEMRDAC